MPGLRSGRSASGSLLSPAWSRWSSVRIHERFDTARSHAVNRCSAAGRRVAAVAWRWPDDLRVSGLRRELCDESLSRASTKEAGGGWLSPVGLGCVISADARSTAPPSARVTSNLTGGVSDRSFPRFSSRHFMDVVGSADSRRVLIDEPRHVFARRQEHPPRRRSMLVRIARPGEHRRHRYLPLAAPVKPNEVGRLDVGNELSTLHPGVSKWRRGARRPA